MFRRNFSNYAAQYLASNTAGNQSWRSAATNVSTNGTALRKPLLRFDGDFCRRIRKEIEDELHSPRVRYQTFPQLGRLIRSFRPGELTIFTGPTGCGKTTLLSQLSLDYCFQGVGTLWGSFEIKPTRLARVMLQQVAARSLLVGDDDLKHQSQHQLAEADQPKVSFNEEAFEEARQVLLRAPLFFMDFFGSTALEAVLDTMRTSMDGSGGGSSDHSRPPGLHQQPIQHIILDNLQFMLSGQHYSSSGTASSSSFDRFDLTDRAVAALRSFATNYNVHVTLVIHPRKELDDVPLGLASVSGTAKATQEADNVIILQKVGNERFIEVKKNRHDGLLGRIPVAFDYETRLLSEQESKE